LRAKDAPRAAHKREDSRPMEIFGIFLYRPFFVDACEARRTGSPIVSLCREMMV